MPLSVICIGAMDMVIRTIAHVLFVFIVVLLFVLGLLAFYEFLAVLDVYSGADSIGNALTVEIVCYVRSCFSRITYGRD